MMPAKNEDLHGNAPDQSATGLLIIDMINDLEFEGGDQLLEPALAAARQIAELKRRAKAAGVPVIYANDNFGRWRSDFREVVEHCRRAGTRGSKLCHLLAPDDDDYFVLKPKHSAFFSTSLETLLEYLGCTRLILTGITGDTCVLFTASEAYMRDFHLHVPQDCIASISSTDNEAALSYMRRVHQADTAPSTELDLTDLRSMQTEDQSDEHSP